MNDFSYSHERRASGKRNRAILATTTLLALPLLASTGHADEIKWKPVLDARVRYENVDQTGFTKDADALTARLRAGIEASLGDFAILVEGEGTLPITEHYNSTTNGKAAYPVVADPENAELNRLQIQYTGFTETTVTVGRQRINIADQRFVGSVGWRQNEQTFDAVRVESKALGPLTADVTYSWSDRTIFGYDSAIKSIRGDNFFATLGGSVGILKLDGFAFLVDQNEPSRLQFSSQTYGLRAATEFTLAEDTKLALTASYARQSDWKDNPNSYKADYWLADAALTLGKIGINANYEILGADAGAAFTSFQTPLATLHKFQGWADKFLTTPANGIRDLNSGASYALGKIAILGPVKIAGAYHDFRSDIGSAKYGHEWNAMLVMKPRSDFTVIAKFADYRADTFSTDTQKIWIEFDYSL
tara:strand:+ start:4515 stop:5768 length:1254 start_codon:yes stop_codon:yes gene_type:complete